MNNLAGAARLALVAGLAAWTVCAPARCAATGIATTSRHREALEAWVAAINSPGEDRLAAFCRERFAPTFLGGFEGVLAFHRDVRESLGRVRIVEIRAELEDRVVALLAGSTGEWTLLTIGVKGADDLRIGGLALVPAKPAPAAPAGVFDGPAVSVPERLAREWVRAFNSGDAERVRRFAERSFASAEPQGGLSQRYDELSAVWGQLVARRVLRSEASKISVLLESAQIEQWLRLDLTATSDEKIDTIAIALSDPPEILDRTYDGWRDLRDLLARVRSDFGLPALAAGVVRSAAPIGAEVVGLRRVDGAEPVERGDTFNLGSVTKSFTATLLAALAEQGRLDPSLPLGKQLAGVSMRPEYAAATLADLLRHRARIQPHTWFSRGELDRLSGLPGTSTEQRAAFVADVLGEEPMPAGFHYSNAGYSVAGLVAERVTGRSWEELIRTELFDPLGMTSAGFGWPDGAGRADQPSGHLGVGEELRAVAPSENPLGSFLAPAGAVRASIDDLGRWARLHLAGLRGADGLLRSETIRALHEGPESEVGEDYVYAAGWVVSRNEDGREMHAHAGSAGTFFAAVYLYPEIDLGVVVLSNAGREAAEAAARRVRDLAYLRFGAG